MIMERPKKMNIEIVHYLLIGFNSSNIIGLKGALTSLHISVNVGLYLAFHILQFYIKLNYVL